MQVLSLFFRFLYRFGYIQQNPAEFIVIPRVDRSLPKDILSKGEMKRLVEAPDVSTDTGIRDRAILETFYASGLRLSELQNLNIEDVDQSGGTVRVNNGKHHNYRVVPLTTHACHWIRMYAQTVRHKYIVNPSELALFIGFRGGRRMNVTLIRLAVKKYARQAGISKRTYPHLIRHSFASHLVANAASTRDVQEMLGHQLLDTTQQYLRVNASEVREMLTRNHPREQNEH
jgi:site-specific recombinase XerD